MANPSKKNKPNWAALAFLAFVLMPKEKNLPPGVWMWKFFKRVVLFVLFVFLLFVVVIIGPFLDNACVEDEAAERNAIWWALQGTLFDRCVEEQE